MTGNNLTTRPECNYNDLARMDFHARVQDGKKQARIERAQAIRNMWFQIFGQKV